MLTKVSPTSKSIFKECRRRWYLSEVERLAPKVPRTALWFGSMIHAGLDGYYAGDFSMSLGLQAYEAYYEGSIVDLRETYGFLWSQMERQVHQDYLFGREMMRNYDVYDHQMGTWDRFTVVDTEMKVRVPIKTPGGRRLVGGPVLSCRIDLVLRDKQTGEIYLWDHKTASETPGGLGLSLDDQLTEYSWAYHELTGTYPTGVLYNFLVKRVPEAPRELKAGGLSKDKSQNTTYDWYLQVLRERGLPLGDYAEILGALKDRGWKGFFHREGVTKTPEQIRRYQERLYHEFADMRAVERDPRLAYPHLTWECERRCEFAPLCQLIEDGGDPSGLVGTMYQVRETHSGTQDRPS